MKKTGCILMAAVLMALILACRGAGKILKSSFTETTAGVPDSGTKKRLVVLDAGHGGMGQVVVMDERQRTEQGNVVAFR